MAVWNLVVSIGIDSTKILSIKLIDNLLLKLQNIPMDNIEKVTTFLKDNSIPFQLHRHPPVVSVEDSCRLIHIDNCLGCKSLFVKDKKSDSYYMAVLPFYKRADMRGIARVVGKEKFEFATAEKMLETLQVVRGNVSPFCFLYPSSADVLLMLDSEIKTVENVRFHPLDNTATVVMKREDFLATMKLLNKVIIWI